MSLTYTPKGELGFKCPEFSLLGVNGKNYSLGDFGDKDILVVLFICNHCPYVKAIEDRYIALAREYAEKSVQFIGICSNDSQEYPEDSFEKLKERWESKNYNFPYLHDPTQTWAKKFGAVCTPDIFVFDKKRNLAYRGRLDDSWKDPYRVTKQELKLAIEELLANCKVSGPQHPSMGCSIKWKHTDSL